MSIQPDNELRMPDHNFRVLVEHAHDAILLLDAEARVLYASPAVQQYGRDPEAMRNHDVWSFLHPDDLAHARHVFQLVLRQPGTTVRFEHRTQDAHGQWRYKDTVVQNLLDDPEVRALVANVRDVTELKQAEHALREAQQLAEKTIERRTRQLRESEAKYRRLIEGLKNDYIFYSQDPDRKVQYISPSVQNVLGYTPEYVMAHGLESLLTNSLDNRQVDDSFQKALGGNSPAHHECEVRHADGSLRIVEYLDVPVFDAQGRVAAVEGIARDITDRKRAETVLREAKEDLEERVMERTRDLQQLNVSLWSEVKKRMKAEEEIRKSEERFREVVEDQTDFIVRWRPDGTRTFVNSSYCRYFGQPREALIGTSFFPTIYSDEERRRVSHVTTSLTPENPTATYEHRVVRKDGRIGWTQWNDRAIFDPSGRLIEYQSVGRDVTDVKEAEDQLRRQEEELAHVARLSVMGEMVAAIGHEVGQPLQAILTFASAASRTLETNQAESVNKARNWTQRIEEQAARAGEIIRRLRDFTRVAESDREPFDLHDTIHGVLALLSHAVQRDHVQLETRFVSQLPDVYADSIQIEQVLVNLIRNACEALRQIPETDRRIRIETTRSSGVARVAICDNGPGMDEHEVEDALRAFHTTKPEGTGIGLSISQRIIKKHGGELEVRRNEAGGMTFEFTVPICPQELVS